MSTSECPALIAENRARWRVATGVLLCFVATILGCASNGDVETGSIAHPTTLEIDATDLIWEFFEPLRL